jgi:hypothetical protein
MMKSTRAGVLTERDRAVMSCGSAPQEQPQADRMPHVSDQLSRLDKSIHETQALVSMVAERLASVLRPEVACPCPPPEQCEGLVPLASALKACVVRVEDTNTRIRTMLDLIEL